MALTETERAALVPEPLVLHKKDQFPKPGGEQSPSSPTPRTIARRLPLYKSPIKTSTHRQITLCTKEPIPTVANSQTRLGDRGARHVPIIIPPNVIDRVVNSLPSSPISPDCKRSQIFPATSLERISLSPLSRRPRHIPIVIPAYAQPYCLLPLTPSSSGSSTLHSLPLTVKGPPTPPLSMSQPTSSRSRASTLDSNVSAPSPTQIQAGNPQPSSTTYVPGMASSQTSLNNGVSKESSSQYEQSSKPPRTGESGAYAGISMSASGQHLQPTPGTTNLSGMVCNVHKCTGKVPHGLVGATTTILGDKLFVFGGRKLSRRRTQLTADLYEMDLIRRHWTKIGTRGNVPPPRYFHSVCALGDNKLVCYGGMSPAHGNMPQPMSNSASLEPEVVVMSDIHVYDVPTQTWTYIPTTDNPQGRYAHCATVLPSSAVFTSANAPLSAIHHNPSSTNPNQGTIGVALDGTGGAEMVVVGGQDSANHYIEQVSVFNLRSLKWTVTHSLGRSCGAYRSVVAPLTTLPASRIGKGTEVDDGKEVRRSKDATDRSSSMLIYSNYNFLDVRLELQVRLSDGSMTEKAMQGPFSPPGLRFPNGGILDNHFVVSGTYLTSSKQEYALWALDLKTLTWSRIDAGGSTFNQGSWNRGILWPRRNSFVILGNCKRSLVEDYNHRRINFSHICIVELESFGLYDNPRQVTPTSSYTSLSAPIRPPALSPKSPSLTAGGRPYFSAAKELGQMAMGLRELADMDLIALTGERIPVNSHILSRRWGPYFVHLLCEGTFSPSSKNNSGDSGSSEVATLCLPAQDNSRNSSITITPTIRTMSSSASTSTLTPANSSSAPTTNGGTGNASNSFHPKTSTPYNPPTPSTISPSSRSRALFLPHTPLTLHALIHYLYTSSLPPPTHNLSTPQILCSLLQLARPYRVDGLLEVVVERLHQVMDGRNAAAVFNASAMAAGGGRGTGFDRFGGAQLNDVGEELDDGEIGGLGNGQLNGHAGNTATRTGLRIDTTLAYRNGTYHNTSLTREDSKAQDSEDDGSSVSEVASSMSASSATDSHSHLGVNSINGVEDEEVWSGEVSCVVGLQKRGLRGLMEGRRMREEKKNLGTGAAEEKGGGEGVRFGLGLV